jgi:hypothetical protein
LETHCTKTFANPNHYLPFFSWNLNTFKSVGGQIFWIWVYTVCWRLIEKPVVCTKFDIYVFSLGIHIFDHPNVTLLPTWFIYNQQKWHISSVNGKSECPGRVKTKCYWLLLRGMHKDWLAWNHDNVSVWSDMSTRGLLLQWTIIIQFWNNLQQVLPDFCYPV